MRVALSILLALLCALTGAEQAAALVAAPGYRFQILGFNQHNAPVDAREAVGSWIRIDAGRENVERLGVPWLSQQIDAALALKLHPILILGQSATRSKDGFASWCGSLKACFGKGALWEVWNEPNGQWSWGAVPSASDYLALFRQVRSAMPASEQLITGGLSTMGTPFGTGLDIPYLLALQRAGVASCGAAGLAIHPYGLNIQDSAQGVGLQVAMARFLSGMDIYCTEAGLKPADAAAMGTTVGDWILDGAAGAQRAGAKCFIVYRWPCGPADDGSFENGMVNPDGSARAALTRIQQEQQTLGRWIGN